MTRHVAVVGGGGAGAAFAARLSEDPRVRVTLLEAGSVVPPPPELRDGGLLAAAVPGHLANWTFDVELLPGRTHRIVRGRLLGGSTAINGAYFTRARPGDFARWTNASGADWSFDTLLPALATLEHDHDESGAFGHGSAGPMPIVRPPLTSRVARAFVAAARALGFPEEPDKNAPGAGAGIGPVPSNLIDGERVSTARAYLDPVRDRTNLSIVGGTRVTRIRFDGARAIGVDTTVGAIDADEIVLCAGAIHTAQLLLVSGIGPSDQLSSFGLPVIANLPVGRSPSDHPNLAVRWRAPGRLDDPTQRFAFPAAVHLDASGAAGLAPEGDLEILLVTKPEHELFASGAGDDSGASPELDPADPVYSLLVSLQRPRSRGRLELASPDPLHPPRIDLRYLSHPEDLPRLRQGVRTAVSLLTHPAFEHCVAELIDLNTETLATNDLLDAWVHEHLATAMHLCGTAPMGPVTDGEGRVHGVAGLRIADTSVLPDVPSRGPANTAVAIGEAMAARYRASLPTPGTPQDHP